MPMDTTIDAVRGIVYHTVHGMFDGSQMRTTLIPETNADGHPSDVVLDLRAIRHLDVTEAALEDMGNTLRNEFPIRLCAIVVSDKYASQLRWFARHAANAFQCVQTFDDLSSARQWLRLSE
ncbi:MAG: STAS/SEC14 domain-containing protein [Pseudomonadota bacterium]